MPGKHRPYFKKRIDELEALLDLHGRDPSVLRTLEDELRRRKTQRAVALRDLVRKKLGVVPNVNGNERSWGGAQPPRQGSDRQRNENVGRDGAEVRAVRLRRPANGREKSPEAVLWRRGRLVSSQQSTAAFFDVQPLPGGLKIALNTSHPAAKYLRSMLSTENDGLTRDELYEQATSLAIALQVMIYAWAGFEDEQTGRSRRMIRNARLEWGRYGEELLDGVSEPMAARRNVVSSASTQKGHR